MFHVKRWTESVPQAGVAGRAVRHAALARAGRVGRVFDMKHVVGMPGLAPQPPAGTHRERLRFT